MEKSKKILIALLVICALALVGVVIALAVTLSNNARDSGTLTCAITEQVIGFHGDKHYMLCQIQNQTVDASDIEIISTGRDSSVNDFSIWNETNLFFLPDRMGERFPNLFVVGSGYTRIRSLQRSNFIGFRRLQGLYITNSELEVIQHDAFQPLSTLVTMNLSNNKIKSINPNWLENKKLLAWLDFSYNEIEIIPQGCFDDLPALESVLLSYNNIRSITSPLFPNNNVIGTLYLMFNPLEFISDTAFDGSFNELTVQLLGSKCFENSYSLLTIPPDDWKSIVRETCNGTNVLSLE